MAIDRVRPIGMRSVRTPWIYIIPYMCRGADSSVRRTPWAISVRHSMCVPVTYRECKKFLRTPLYAVLV